MFRKALLTLTLLFASAPAFAQNTTCSDRPTTDSSNACANTRFVQSHTNTVVVPISAYGAKCDNVTDDTTAIQNAWNAAALVGSDVWLGGVGVGICRISSLTMPTPTGEGRASFLTGPGSSLVRLESSVTGTTCAINVSATFGVNSYLRGAFQGFAVEQSIVAMGGYGICLNNITQLTFRDVMPRFFARGISGIDSISIDFVDMTFFYNRIGLYGSIGTVSPPNNWTVDRSQFLGNDKNAISLIGPNLLNVTSTAFQSNAYNAGLNPATIDIIGPPGGPVVGANIINSYFESNGSPTDIRLDQNGISNGVGIYNVINSNFIRTLSTQLGAIQVLNTGTGTAKTTVNVGGNGFYDNLANTSGFAWLSAQTPATTNYTFNCVLSNRVDIAAEMPALCRNNSANTVPMVDVNSQYIGYGTQLQLTALINVATASLSGAVPAWPNDATKFFNGAGAYTVPTASGIAGGAPLTKTDDTNVTLTLGGTPSTALLNAASITVGWAGTLSVARGGTASASASGTALDNITGFAGTGFIKRTGAGTYTFTADPSDVTSVFGRTGAVVATANDYNFNQLAGTISVAQVGGSGASHAVPVDVAGTITWKVVTDCNGSATALNYTQSTDTWSCNSGIAAGSAITATNTVNVGITDDTTTNATMDLAWVTGAGGNFPVKVSSTKLNFNPSTGSLSSPLAVHSTSVSSPLYIGGSGTTGTQLTLQTTSGVGTTDSYAFKGGNNGATTFATLQTGSFNVQSGSAYSIGGTAVVANNATYTFVNDPAGVNTLVFGNTGDPSNYFGNTTHTFRNRAANANFLVVNSTGSTFSGLIVPNVATTLTCGSGCASVAGNPQKMAVTTGAAQTSVTVNFGITWSAAPICTISSNSTASVVDITSTTTTTITFGASVALTGAVINALCF